MNTTKLIKTLCEAGLMQYAGMSVKDVLQASRVREFTHKEKAQRYGRTCDNAKTVNGREFVKGYFVGDLFLVTEKGEEKKLNGRYTVNSGTFYFDTNFWYKGRDKLDLRFVYFTAKARNAIVPEEFARVRKVTALFTHTNDFCVLIDKEGYIRQFSVRRDGDCLFAHAWEPPICASEGYNYIIHTLKFFKR